MMHCMSGESVTSSAKRFTAVYFLGSCAVMLLGSLMPTGNGPVVVFANPWGKSAVEVVAHANGTLMAAPLPSWVAMAEATDSGFISRLYQAGAGFVASSTVAYACARMSGTSWERQ